MSYRARTRPGLRTRLRDNGCTCQAERRCRKETGGGQREADTIVITSMRQQASSQPLPSASRDWCTRPASKFIPKIDRTPASRSGWTPTPCRSRGELFAAASSWHVAMSPRTWGRHSWPGVWRHPHHTQLGLRRPSWERLCPGPAARRTLAPKRIRSPGPISGSSVGMRDQPPGNVGPLRRAYASTRDDLPMREHTPVVRCATLR